MSVTNPKRPKPHTYRSHGSEQRRMQRQMEAEERKAARAKRTPEEQLAVLAARGINSGREYDRLAAKTVAPDEARRVERRKKFKKVS